VGRKDATTNVKALYSISDNPYTYAGGIAGYISNTWNNETTVTGNYSRLKTQAGHTDTLTYGARYSSSYGTFNNNREFDPDDYPDPEPTPSAVIPTITTSSLPDTTKGTAYTATLTASGTTPITWSLYAGSLPTGLTLSETGTISGTPSAAGTYTFTVKASNSGGEVLKSYTIIVEEVEEEIYPEILTESLPDAKVGKEYSVQVRATVTDGMTWESHGDMPAGLSINASTGFISGTPIKAGVYALDIWLVKEEVIYGSTVRRYENREYTLTVTEDESSRVYGEEGYEEHGGSEDDAWEINSVEVLIKVRDDTNSGTLQAGKYFRLTADLDLTSYTDWEPVGKLEGYHGFGCHFDGDGHTITVDISRTAKETGKEYLAGVFGYVRNAEIKNLSVTGNVILDVSASTVNFHYAGGIAAYALSGVTIDNCKFDGKVSMTGADYLNAGGIVGNAYSSVLTNNTVGGRDTSTVVETLPVTQVGWAGGIVGFVSSNCTVTGNYSRLSTQGKYTKTLTCGRGKEDGTFANNIEIDTSGSESSATAPKITSSINLGTFNTGDSVSIQLKADGTKPITWMVSGGTLPDGLTLSSAGLISGKISVSESFTFTITASNTAGRDSGTFLISVENPSSVTHRYQLISSSMTWTAAKAYCESLGGHLATITSQAEYDEVLKLLPENERRIYWIGAYRDSTDSTEWKWVTGEDFTFTAWQDGEPNNARGNECYMELTNYQGNYNGQWGWNDENDSNLYSYVTGLLCEWDEEEQTVTAPEITTYTLPDGTVGTEYSAQLNAKGTTPITWTAYGLPDGLSMNSDGLISGTPTMLGSYVPSITAGNSAGNDSRVYKIVIAEPKSTATAPVITTGSNLGTHTVGLSVSIQLSATGTTPITWMKTDGNLPGGLTLDEDGLLSGTLTDAGTYSFLISATNTAGSVSRRFSLTAVTITPSVTAPTITTSPDLGKIEAGGSVSVKLKATGTTPITWSAEGLPDGLSISSAGLIYGTVTTAWEYSFAVTAENSAGSDMRTFTLKVEDAAVAPSITTAQDLGTFEYEDSISVQIEATGTDPITWTATGLPTWLEIDADSGAISGTAPKRTGDYSFTVTARNSKGTDSRKFTLKVKSTASVVTAPTITTAALHDGETGVIYTAMLEATGTDPITWNVAGLPEGFTPNVSSGKLSGVPKTGGTFTLTVTATNSAGHDTKEYTLTIAEKIKVSPPKITTGNLPEATEGQPYTFKFEAEGEKLTWSATSKTMTWFTFTNDGVFSGTPDAAGTYNLTVKVRNTAGADYANFTLKVKSSGGNLKVPEVKTTRLPDACKDEEYRCFLEGEGENLTWALAAEQGYGLPRGLTLDEDGLISGLVRESTVGTFRFRVTATNSAGTSPVKTVSIKVTGKAPEFTTQTLKAAKWNKKYSFALKVRNMKPTAWSIEGELPEGIKFDKGKFTGKATEVDEYNLTITASNGAVTLTDDFTLTVQGVTPKIKGSFKKGTEGQPYTSVLKAKGVTPITWDFEDLPAGLDYTTDATGEVCTISGVPEKAFSDKIKVTIETGDEQTY
ncbi:MAG: putative Ig domain-containing protein, partial [Synergistaceae bacterium]|nr:putative Ig domain-containing protein [Synergistaceae bacterium]